MRELRKGWAGAVWDAESQVNEGCEGPTLRLGEQGLGWGQQSFPREMTSGPVVSGSVTNIAGERRGALRVGR